MASASRRKRLLVQGATGSIGTSTMSVVRAHRDRFEVVGLSGGKNFDRLLDLAGEFAPQSIALEDPGRENALAGFAKANGIRHAWAGQGAALTQAAETEYDLLVNAQLGSAGLTPTMASLERGIPVALANKETLVAAGPVVMQAANKHGTYVIPIDSEHSAIFQCLVGEAPESVRRIWLTTSGGPFWGRVQSDLTSVTVEQALAHPTWKMGPKITVDSATLFNKGLEVIETNRLFGVGPEQIKVVAHRQSVVHSMVEFADGSIKAQLGNPDMRLPILYALSYPDRVESEIVRTNVAALGTLTFEEVKDGQYPCLDLAFEALRQGGTAPAALSAADEVAVHAFLGRNLRFTEIPEVIAEVMRGWPHQSLDSIEIVLNSDARARALARELVSRHQSVMEIA